MKHSFTSSNGYTFEWVTHEEDATPDKDLHPARFLYMSMKGHDRYVLTWSAGRYQEEMRAHTEFAEWRIAQWLERDHAEVVS